MRQEQAARAEEHAARVDRSAIASGDAEALFCAGLERSMLETDDPSNADFHACGSALKHGAHPDDVAEALRRHSPDLEERHPSTDDYIERTLRAAGATRYVLGRDRRADEPDPPDRSDPSDGYEPGFG